MNTSFSDYLKEVELTFMHPHYRDDFLMDAKTDQDLIALNPTSLAELLRYLRTRIPDPGAFAAAKEAWRSYKLWRNQKLKHQEPTQKPLPEDETQIGDHNMTKEPGLTVEEHDELGFKLQTIHDELSRITIQLGAAYGAPISGLAVECLKAANHLRDKLDNRITVDHPQFKDPSKYTEANRLYYRGQRDDYDPNEFGKLLKDRPPKKT